MTEKEHIDWREYYVEREFTDMPWYYPELSPDLAGELKSRNIASGSFLDLGTGAGTQAIGLFELGFEVTATDVSANAPPDTVKQKYPGIHFLQDDFFNSRLEKRFDYCWDRGCYHNFDPDVRALYVQIMHGLLNPGGMLFLKCFSTKQERIRPTMPYTFTPEQIRREFEPAFKVLSIRDSILRGSLSPHVLFVVMRREDAL